ncbi:hypothetical protein BCL90_1150 [Pedobacter alluvionis]|uniref:Uncharacterized protein n=1 Tax=Pedobacter alluvionis TaxID=475253 RepID=A0A497YD39_9SPHI|nr:hypothetical protein BCL90_1150 [Pedobacter alluvionis]
MTNTNKSVILSHPFQNVFKVVFFISVEKIYPSRINLKGIFIWIFYKFSTKILIFYLSLN